MIDVIEFPKIPKDRTPKMTREEWHLVAAALDYSSDQLRNQGGDLLEVGHKIRQANLKIKAALA